MHTMMRCAAAVLLAWATTASTCSTSDNRVTGTYTLSVFESQDTCDQELNSFGSVATISTQGEGYVIDFGDEGELVGDFNAEGILVAQGTIDDQGGGRTTTMLVGLVIRQGQITDGSGRITYNGTYPGNDDVCIQEFVVTGKRNDSHAPVVG